MKDFVKMTLAVLCGIFIALIVLFVLGIGFVGSLAAVGSAQPSLPKQGVLYVDMSKFALAEQSAEADPMAMIQGQSTASIGLWDAVQALNQAATDPAVQFVYLRPEGAAVGIAQAQEFRAALAHFRESGKAVIARVENPSTLGMYLASVADKIYMASYEGGTNMFTGISSQLVFLKDLLDKLGVNVQLIRHGKYKSAGEMFIKNAPSPENLEQNEVMIQSIWRSYAEEITQSRGLTVEALDALIEGLRLNFPEDFLNAGLVDALMDRNEFMDKLADLAMVDKFEDVKFIQFGEYVKAKKALAKAKQKIAIIYADGEIMDGAGRQGVSGQYFAQVISDVRKDEKVKAVVFRVNSPGGSVFASEMIKTEIELLCAEKPVVASYGEYAASGGYWISAGCPKIFADKGTLTGSIGVFSMIPDLSGTLKNIAHVNVTSVNSHKHSDILGLMRPFDAEETAYMQASVERIYDRFVQIVSDGRGLEPDFVDSIAQGRVWTGADAIGIGLVDEIGTLEDAVRYAIAQVSESPEEEDLSHWNIAGYPKPQTTMERLMEMIGSSACAHALTGTPFEGIGDSVNAWAKKWMKADKPETMFARMPYEIVINQ